MSEQNNNTFSQGWDIVKACNEALKNKDYNSVRQQMSEYFKLGISKAGNLHSAILSIAVKLGTLSADFHLVPFLNIWDLENLRPEDGEGHTDERGRRIPSLVERLAKSYAYALLFHPNERLDPELESIIAPLLQKYEFLPSEGPNVGYVDFIDPSHGHTHIYDNESRHFVAETSRIRANTGDYVIFTPIIPKNSNFKTAFIHKILSPAQGPAEFGWRKAKVTFVDAEKGYATWELQDPSHPIIESNTTEPSFTKGYINQSLATALNKPLPQIGTEIDLIVYLKRGRDKQKRPHVIFYK